MTYNQNRKNNNESIKYISVIYVPIRDGWLKEPAPATNIIRSYTVVQIMQLDEFCIYIYLIALETFADSSLMEDSQQMTLKDLCFALEFQIKFGGE